MSIPVVVCRWEAFLRVITQGYSLKSFLGFMLCAMAMAGGCERSSPVAREVATTVAQAGGRVAIQDQILILERNKKAVELAKSALAATGRNSENTSVGVLPSSTSVGVVTDNSARAGVTPLKETRFPLPSKGTLPSDDLIEFASQLNPVPGWIDEATGGAPNPEADSGPIKDAFEQLALERANVQTQGHKLRDRIRQLLVADTGEGPRISFQAHRFKSQRLLGPELDGAIIRFDRQKHLGVPAHGGKDMATSFLGMGLLLATEGTDAFLGDKHSEARTWYARQARFGALVARWAQSLAELSAGVTVAQEGLSLLAMVIRRSTKLNSVADPKDIDIARHALGLYASSLRRAQLFFKDKERYLDWLKLARGVEGTLWRYEAIHALAVARLVEPEHPLSDAIETALRNLAVDSGEKSLSAIAREQVQWLEGMR
jgi:hypothetical protein